MGRYKLEKTKSVYLKPVYKKIEKDFYIFYSSKILLNLIAYWTTSGSGHWTVGPNVTGDGDWMRSKERGTQTLQPSSHWEYWDGEEGTWLEDETLTLEGIGKF